MPGVFVTATGTEAGKTYVSLGLIRACRRAGRPVDALKPVISGFDAEAPEGSDTVLLLRALGVPPTSAAIATLSPWRFKAPLSPDMAARLEDRTVPFDALVATCRAALSAERLTIIEGVGGAMVPLDGCRTVLDLMAVLHLPVLVVSPTGLGSISHLLTSLAALRGRGLVPFTVVLNDTPGSSVPLDLTLETLGRFVSPDDLVVLRRSAPQDAVFDAILARLDAARACLRAERP